MSDKTMRYFLDFEFLEDGRTIDPVSLGVACEDGRELYIEFADVDWSKANDWVLENVKPHLWQGKKDWVFLSKAEAAAKVLAMVGTDTPEFWADYGAYDWVALCQLYGPMMDLPRGWPMFCRDIQQEGARLGVTEFPMSEDTHNALNGARVCRHRFLYLEAQRRALGS